MDNNEIKDLSNYRLEQAKENLEEAIALLDINKFKGASNRAYYSIFHAIKAILALEETDFKKHSSVIAYFNKNYINTEIFPKELGHRISLANAVREDSDYLDSYMINKKETEEQIETAKDVSKYAEEYIRKWLKEHTDLSDNEIDKQIIK